MNDFIFTEQSYSSARERLVERIQAGLRADPRIAAAWLSGSYGRGEQDAVSDIDLVVVIEEAFAAPFCAWSTVTSSSPPEERMKLFSKFGTPANIHENHNNAPAGGSFSSVLYVDPPVIVDWTITPHSRALRPRATLLLFDRVGVPRLNADQIEISPGQESAPLLSERNAFFWMMAAVTAKYIVRERSEEAQELLVFLEKILGEIESFFDHPVYNTETPLFLDATVQSARLQQLCDRIEALGQQSSLQGELSFPNPRGQVEAILGILKSKKV